MKLDADLEVQLELLLLVRQHVKRQLGCEVKPGAKLGVELGAELRVKLGVERRWLGVNGCWWKQQLLSRFLHSHARTPQKA